MPLSTDSKLNEQFMEEFSSLVPSLLALPIETLSTMVPLLPKKKVLYQIKRHMDTFLHAGEYFHLEINSWSVPGWSNARSLFIKMRYISTFYNLLFRLSRFSAVVGAWRGWNEFDFGLACRRKWKQHSLGPSLPLSIAARKSEFHARSDDGGIGRKFSHCLRDEFDLAPSSFRLVAFSHCATEIENAQDGSERRESFDRGSLNTRDDFTEEAGSRNYRSVFIAADATQVPIIVARRRKRTEKRRRSKFRLRKWRQTRKTHSK